MLELSDLKSLKHLGELLGPHSQPFHSQRQSKFSHIQYLPGEMDLINHYSPAGSGNYTFLKESNALYRDNYIVYTQYFEK